MNLKLKYTQSSQLSSLPVVDGQLIILTDRPGMYYDLNSTRNPVKVDVEDSLSSSSATAALSAKQGKALNDSLSKTYKLQGKVTHNKLPATGAAINDMYIMNDTFVAGSNFVQQGKTIAKGTPVVYNGAKWDALYIGEYVGYNNTTSGLSATNVQDAIDETAGVELTQAQYDALPAAQKSSGTYYITDAPGANMTIDTALSSTSTNPVQNKVVNTAISTLTNALSNVGTVYQTITPITYNVPASTETEVLSLSNLPKGVYMATAYCKTFTGNVTEGLIGIKTTGGIDAVAPVGNPNYIFNGSVSNVFELTANTNTVSVRLNVHESIKLGYGRLTVVRIK